MRRRGPEQLSLLDWVTPRTVIPFPCGARLGRARQVARDIGKRTTEAGKDAAWDRHVAALTDELTRHGATPDQINAELNRFVALCDRLMAPGADRREG
ncbi:hypothetical protein SAMN02983003_0689 [Devosia enhydra]|uniref:Uncharacterized protein n=1 Tax=Devosia enhydra TaxID=665118 RepID=A0A1K2HTZ9_9HYPH|nr:DUF6074 family protein [Devosia enhydra]SFZ81782.1 hypothetical protein SAMN02983003_0689 [Devosia enhydra]